MIEVYPVKIEAVDDIGEIVFKLETFDESAATIEIKTLVAPGKSLDELLNAIRQGVDMLKLKEAL